MAPPLHPSCGGRGRREREPGPAPLPPGACGPGSAGRGGIFPPPLLRRVSLGGGRREMRSPAQQLLFGRHLDGLLGKRVCRLLVSLRPEPTSRRWPISVVERRARGVRCSEPANGNGGLRRCWRGCGGHLVAAGCAARRVFAAAEAGAAAGPARPGPARLAGGWNVPKAPPHCGLRSDPTFFSKVWPSPCVGCLEWQFLAWVCRGGRAGLCRVVCP